MSTRVQTSTGTIFEERFGYSRAVRKGPGQFVSVAGCTATTPDGAVVGQDDMRAQAHECLSRLGTALKEIGAAPADVVRTRVFLTDMSRWPQVGAEHIEFFGDTRPVTTVLEVSALVLPEVLVAIDADAVLDPAE